MNAPNRSDFQDGNLDNVLEIINRLARKSAGGDYIYRGEPKHYDKVSSSLYRKLTEQFQVQGIIDVSEIPVEDIQAWILDEAEKFTASDSEIKQSETLILSQLQHYGGETNLIDFTTDYLTALFFACDGEIDKDGRVIFLSKSGDMSQHITRSSHPANRVMAQKSIFVRPPKGYIEPDDTIPIPHELKQPILDYLRICHCISTESIYNDFHGFIRVQALHQQAYTRLYAGITCYENGDLGGAIEYYNKALDLNPRMASAFHNRGLAHYANSHYNFAIDDFTRALALEPDNSDAYHNRGLAHHSIRNYNFAINDFTKALELDPEISDIYYNRGVAYYINSHYDFAIDDFTKVLDLDPDNFEVVCLRGDIYFAKGEYILAARDYNKALELNPDDAGTYYYCGVAYLCWSHFPYAQENLINATNKGADIKRYFSEEYGSIAEFEHTYGVELPEFIRELLV